MKTLRIFTLFLLALAVLGLSSCGPLLDLLLGGSSGVTEEERIEAFKDDLNNSYLTGEEIVERNFHSEMDDYDTLTNDLFAQGPFWEGYQTFEIGEPTIDDSNGNKLATCTFSSGQGDGEIIFTLAMEDGDYKILRIDLTIGSNTITYQRYSFGGSL